MAINDQEQYSEYADHHDRMQQKQFSAETLKMSLTTTDNKQAVFQDIIDKHKGKTIVMEVWASWCGDCVKAMPKLKRPLI